MQRRLMLALGAWAGLSACAGPSPLDYAQEKPLLDLKQYFNGVIDAWGIFTDRSGRVVKRFAVVMNCSWQGESGILDEDFVYSDGTQQKRIWKLQHLGNGQYEGAAADVVGKAKGQTSGNAFQWNYTLSLPVDGRVWPKATVTAIAQIYDVQLASTERYGIGVVIIQSRNLGPR